MWRRMKIKQSMKRQFTSIADQAGHAGIALLCLIAFGRWLGTFEFGALMAGYALWLLFESLQRATILIPSVISISRHGESAAAYGSWSRIGLLFGLLCAALTAIAGTAAVMLESRFWSIALLSGAAFTLLGCTNVLFRRLAFHAGRYMHIFIGCALAVAAILGVSAYFIATSHRPTLLGSILLYCAFYLISPMVIALAAPRTYFTTPLPLWSVFSDRLAFIAQMSAGSIAQYFYNNGVQLLMAVFSTPLAVAAFSASRTMARPLFILSSAMFDAERSQAAKRYAVDGSEGLHAMLRPMTRLFIFVFTPVILLMAAAAPYATHLAFGGKYDDYGLSAVFWIIALVPQILSFPLDIVLTTLGDSAFLMRSRFEAASICIGTFFCGLLFMPTVSVNWGISAILVARIWLLIRNAARYRALQLI